jgi:hypothetical protein
MTNTPDNTPISPELPPSAEDRAGDATTGDSGAPRRGLPTPSARVTAILAAATLGLGVVVGAAIGPAPSASLAIGRLIPLLPSLETGPTSTTQTPPVAPAATPAPSVEPVTTAQSTPSSPATTPTTTTPASTPAPAPASKGKTSTLAPTTHVWLIKLDGAGFEEALAQASAAPYLTGQAVPAGTLLSGWSGLDASAFASEAALLAEPSPQLLDTITQPPCPEGAAGTACAAGTPGAITAADEFLKATLPTITSSGPYREDGLVVITFATIASATATSLPAGAATATLTTQPPSGALLISPFAKAGARSTVAFNPTSPKQSLEKLLHP